MRRVVIASLLSGLASALLLGSTVLALAQTEHVLYEFKGGSDGDTPEAAVIADWAGNLYGTTGGGGAGGGGTIFELLRPTTTGGAWTESVLYSFRGVNGADGESPTSPLTFDQAGNLYGAALIGGKAGGCGSSTGCGVIFELAPPTFNGGSWTESVIYSFQGGTDGFNPGSNLALDNSGNLYGTTIEGGGSGCGGIGCGMVFELSPPTVQGGAWTERVLYAFQGGRDGSFPIGLLTADNKGNLYGSTQGGGKCSSCGTVFKLVPPSVKGGTWTERVLHYFQSNSSDGMGPLAGPTYHQGSLYGTTEVGGVSILGTVYQLTLTNGGRSETVLYSFGNNPADVKPAANLISDKAGNLYGTNSGGGTLTGTVFELQPPSQTGGNWTETILHAFTDGPDGGGPYGGLLLRKGTLYGTASAGGSTSCGSSVGCGVIFAITP